MPANLRSSPLSNPGSELEPFSCRSTEGETSKAGNACSSAVWLACHTGRFPSAFPGWRNAVEGQHSLEVVLSDVLLCCIWDGKSLFCGNQYHNGGRCWGKQFLSQASVWSIFPHLFDHLTWRKTCCSFEPGFVISPSQEDETNISMKVL